jgi:hypothetical protein
MTIIYIHGVNVRSPVHGVELGKPFLRWLGPKIATGVGGDPEYEPVFWGDAAAHFRWELKSRPRTSLLGQGGTAGFEGLGAFREASATPPVLAESKAEVDGGPVLGRATGTARVHDTPPLSSVPVDRRADFLVDLYLAVTTRAARSRQAPGYADPIAEEPRTAGLAAAAASVATRWDQIVSKQASEDGRAAALVDAVDRELIGDSTIAMGGWADWAELAGETLRRAASFPGGAVSTVFAELRPTLNTFVANFVGDVFAYLDRREVSGTPGEIPCRVLPALARAHARKQRTGEKIVVLTHSMGGQLLYDAVTYFAKKDAVLKDLVIDHWFTCGSQVSLFAELTLFRAQPDISHPAKLPRPPAVLKWTNFFDRNDLFGFIMAPVFDGVDDQEYSTGYGLAFAHTGYLARPSFFEGLSQLL